MPSISLKIILEDGAVTRTMKFPDGATVADAVQIVEEKVTTGGAGKDYGLFLTSADDELSGCWLEDPQRLDYYLLKDGDSLHYRCRVRNLKIRMLDGSVKTMQVDESKSVETLMMNVCGKLGITNYEEYGLCREDEPMEEHPATGTLTLKRKHQPKEKDAALHQLSKKLKTDDNVEWLEHNKTLREMAVAPAETLLLKRRLFYSDRKVDARDPVQLNLLYVQARDAVLEGRHPVTEEQAAQFAGIQCQVQYGDYQEEKHKHGFIENLSEFLPQNYANSWGMEKKVTKEHSKHSGLSQLEAKHLYTKTARDLPTYGVTFFLVKEMQKGKKKLVPRLLGINASSILRLDETTKEVLQVWPLTQVKTYKAGRGEMFTLNFGDYSEKEYCVKTNDAYRIRDILQGYIDLIRKKMEAAFNNYGDEGGVIHSATVECSKGTTMEMVSHSALKGVETSFVGPSKIISTESGSKAESHGAQIVTAHTVIVTNKQHSEQSALATNATMRGEMSIDTGKKLNDLNANAVKIVTLLNDPNEANISEAKKIIEVINKDSPTLIAGVKHCIDHQTDEAAKKKLTFELNELTDNIALLNEFKNPQEAQEAAMRIADLTTQMYFALDARVKRRSQLVRSSRNSFIQDEKTQATLHRASFINCVGAANHAIDDARDTLHKQYDGPALSPEEVEALERSARDRLAKLNAAIARLAAAHADPKNIDYAEAVSAMNTIRELVPKLANDAHVLSAVKDGKDRRSLLNEMQELLDATGKITQTIGCDDLQKMHDEADNFAKKSRRLQFIFGHGAHPDKENEIIDLAKEVDDKTRLLVATANQLASEVDDPGAPKVKDAADKCANAAGGLTSCAQLTASSVHEPHCRSALSAAVEDLASSEKLLDTAYRPLLEHPEGRNRSDLLKHQSADLRKALDRLRNAYCMLDGDADIDGPEATGRKRLQFVHTLSGGQKALDACDQILKNKYQGPAISPKEAEQLERSARDRLARLNAAIARLTAAHADPANIDYAAAAEAMDTIRELAPELANDAQALSTAKDGKDRRSLIKELQELLDATGKIYQNIECQDLQKMQEEADNYRIKARRLQFILGQTDELSKMILNEPAGKGDMGGSETERKRVHFARTLSGGQQTLDSCDKILKDKYKGPAVSPQQAEALEKSARDRLAKLNAAIARLTAAHADPNNVDYAAAAQAMETIKELAPELANGAQALSSANDGKDRKDLIKELQDILDSTGKICQSIESQDLQKMKEEANKYNIKARRLQFILGQGDGKTEAEQERAKLQYMSSLSEAKNTLNSCEKLLEDDATPKVVSDQPLWKRIGDLNAAIASLVAATRDGANPNYSEASRAMADVVRLMPDVVSGLKHESASCPAAKRDEIQADTKALCDAVRALAVNCPREDLNQAIADYAQVSGKLTYNFDNYAKEKTEHDLIDSAKAACVKVSDLLAYVYGVAAEVGGASGEELDAKGTNVADAAQEFLSCIQINAPTIHGAKNKSVVLQSTRDLESAMDNLARAWAATCKSQKDIDSLKHLDTEAKKELHNLIVAIQEIPEPKDIENKRLGVSILNAREAIDRAEKDIKKPLSSKLLAPAEERALQQSLANKLASLNAAIAALMIATRDQSNVNYEMADSAVGVIQRMVPELVEDVRTLGSGKEIPDRRLLMEELQALCAATKALGDGARHGNPEELKKAVGQYTAAAGRLTFTYTPHPQMKKNQEQVVNKANKIFDRSSMMVAAANKLANQSRESGNETSDVEEKVKQAEYAANALVTATELSALTVNAPQCQSAIHQAAAELSQAITQLGQATEHLVGADLLGQQRKEFDDAVKELMDTLKALEGDSQQLSAAEREKYRLKFVASRSAAQKDLDDASQELKKKYHGPAISPKEAEQLERSARDRLARLNAAIARLTAAHADPNNVDYAAAAQAMETIKELAPELANGAQALSSANDGKDRKDLIKELQNILDSTGKICQSIESQDLQKMQEEANKYNIKSRRLQFILGQGDGKTEAEQERPKLQYMSSLSEAKNTLNSCEKLLEDNATPKVVSDQPLWKRIGDLNAAIASLVAATRDGANPNYSEANRAMADVVRLMPDVVSGLKHESASCPAAKRDEIQADTKALCDAVRALAVNCPGEDLNQAIADYAQVSGKLTYNFDNYAKQKTEHDLIDSAKAACVKVSDLLAYVYGVAAEVGGASGEELDTKGTNVADATQEFLSCIQLNAPTIHGAKNKSVVLQSTRDLESAMDNLARAWAATCKSQKDIDSLKHLNTEAKKELHNLVVAIQEIPEPKDIENKRLGVSILNAREAIDRAEKDIKKPLSSKLLAPTEERALQQSLANKLASLNAAIAALMIATRDQSNVNYEMADSAVGVIQRIVPELVEDVRTLSSGKEIPDRRLLMEELQALCAATKALGDGTRQGNPEELKKAVGQYAAAAGRLTFTCTPHPQMKKNQEQVVNKANKIFDRSSMMVAAANKLANQSRESGNETNDVEEKVKQAEYAANALVTATELSALTVNAPQCQSAIHQAAAELSQAITQLGQATEHLVGADLLGQQRKDFDDALKELMATMKALEGDSQQLSAAEREKNRLKFVASRSAAKKALDDALQEVKETGKVAPLAPPQAALLQAKLADRLATLNAAIATLLTATRDPEKPDYVLAESATATIQELMPDLVKDAKTLPAGKDDAGRAQLLAHLHELCDATKALNSGEYSGKENELQEVVAKFTNASGKLVYTFNPRANPAKEGQIIDLTKSTCQKTSELLEKVYDLAQTVDAQASENLDAQGARLADAAQNLLTTAEITAPSISAPLCQSSLLTSVSALSSSVDHLFSSPTMTSSHACAKREQLQQARAKVDQEIEKLKEALKEERVLDATAIEKAKKDKLRFIAAIASAEVAVQNVEKEITEPYGKPLPASAATTLEESLANRLAHLNAAINSLVVATSDHNNPDYLAAESASKAIRELIPDIVKDSRSLSSSKDPKSRKELLEQIKALCEATRRLGASAKSEQLSPEALNEAATRYSLASGKLNFVFNPHADQKKTHQIIDTCKSTCQKTSEMLQRVHELAKEAGKDGSTVALDAKGSAVSDAARALLTTAQLTAHSTHSTPCQTALLTAADHLSSSIQDLQATWTPVVKAPKFKASGEQLAKDTEAVDTEIVKLRHLVQGDVTGVKGKRPPAVPVRTGSLKKAKPKAPETRVIDATSEFLDKLRCESSKEKECKPIKSPLSPTRTEEEKRDKLQFTKSVQDARKSICSAEDILQKAFKSDGKVRASLDDAQIFALNKQMEHKLARANAAAAHLLACRGGDKPDYKLASKCVCAVSDLMPTIATDAITLADLKDPVGRKLFLGDTLELCSASKALCDTAKSDKKKVKEVALELGNRSSKLLYALNTDIDPSQEKEVLLRVKAAGDIACRITESSTEGPAAGRCAGQATILMYTAKLVAPSIQDPECQDSLITASNDLSAQLKTLPTTKHPKLAQELQEMEKILESLRSDVTSGRLVKRKEEKLVIEDTPLRKLTAQIIEDSKQNAECTTNSTEERRAMADFANKLSDALKIMDVANARCKKAPHDMKKREELEDAVLNLQQLVLQCRPRGGAAGTAQTNIVNLSDFLQDVSTNADRLNRAASSAEQSGGPHARAAATVSAQCHDLCAAATRSTTTQHGLPMLDVEHAAKECVSRVQKINTTIECCPEGAGKATLQKEARPLNESSTLLQYASQSALATAQCAALDEALNDLTDLENRIDKMLQPRQGEKHTPKAAPSASLLSARAQLATAAAGAGREAQQLAPAFTRYVAEMRAHVDVADQQKRMRLADHLKKLQDRLKLLTMETGRQVVTWRPANEGEVVPITEDILKELDNAEEVIGVKSDKTQNSIAYEDLKKLLLPVDTYTMEGDKKKLEAKLEPYATKLNSMAETLTLSVGKPGSLARSAHVTAESAVQLTALAKALKSDEDPTKNSKIDEASQELCFVTYNLLKTAESVSQDANTFKSRRRMMDACRSLSDAINKLVRASSSSDKLARECNELNRALQLRQSTLQPRPTCALPYTECISVLQTQHDAIKNLKSDEPVSREEFSNSLDYLASAVSNNADYAEHCAYLLSLSEQHPQLAKDGMFDTTRVQKLIATAQDSCFRVTRPGIVDQAKEESSLLSKELSDLKQAIQECSTKVTDEGVKRNLLDASSNVDAAGMKLQAELNTANVSLEKLTPSAFSTIEALSSLRSVTEHPSLAPQATPSPAAQKRADEVIEQSKELLNRASGLMRAIKTSEDQQAMTWVMFNTYTKGVIEISEKLIQCIRENGQQANLIEGAIEEDEHDMTSKSYVQTQVLIANKWLQKPTFKAQVKTNGEQAARNVIDIGKKMMTHLKEAEREEMGHLVQECEQLLAQCIIKYNLETGSVLMDRLKDLAKAVDRSIVTMVVEDLLEDEEPLSDLDILVDAERDEAKRKFLLERKIADLLAHLGRVTKTARVVADGQGSDGSELQKCTNQAELLAPMLVKAAEKRVICPSEKAVVEEYQTQLAQYSESLSRVRDLCDRAVDPMQFVQTAEETMQRMKEESTAHQNDLQKCTHTSTAIRKLAHRVVNVSMSSQNAQRDPELMRALKAAQQKLKEAEPARTLRASKMPDWRNNITEILRATGEVESVLGGEMIFKEQRESDQPIYNAALNLHAAVREWSARDNEIVAVAKRTAVLMAKLSDHMRADRKREVISTSKAIVTSSLEVARLGRKLALECTDMRIRTNLLQVCDQIPTISGQLKMLTTVKGSFLGHQGSDEDIEAMNMLIGNAQNLMMSIQDVVKAAASASVKIRSQRGGPRIRWVRKTYH